MRIVIYVLAIGSLLAGCGGGGTAVKDLAVGDCFNDPDTEIVETLDVAGCDEPHDNEVYANLVVEESLFPGDEVIADFAVDVCLPPFETYVGASYIDSELDYAFLAPTATSGNTLGDRNITCFLYSADLSKLTTSARADS